MILNGLPQSRERLRHLMLREGDIGLAHPIRGYCLIVKLGRDDASLAQLLGAVEIQPRLLGLRVGQRESSFGGFDLGEHLIHGLLGAGELRLGLIDATWKSLGSRVTRRSPRLTVQLSST